VFIGSMLPFVVLVVVAYLIYRYNKKRINKE
jgi:preprotein translocase subunit YajC